MEIEKLQKLVKDIESREDLPEEKIILSELANKLIREEELRQRSEEYFKHKYYIGYFLIESQKIERTVVGIIESIERFKSFPAEPQQIDLQRSLGPLIIQLEKNIRGEEVISPLKEFNKYRKRITHRLHQDYTRNLKEIEDSICNNYPPEKINKLHSILIEVERRISVKLIEQMDDDQPAKAVGSEISRMMQEILGQDSLHFEIPFKET